MKDSSEIDIKFGKFSLKGRSVLKDRTNLNDLNLQVDYSEKLNKILGKNKKIESSRVIGKKSYGKAKYFEIDRESNSRQKNSFLKLDKYDYGNVNNKIGTPEYRNEQSEIYTEHSYDDSILENQENTRKTRKKSKFYLEKQLYDSNSSENIENIEINRFNGLRLYLKNIESPSLHVKNKKKIYDKEKRNLIGKSIENEAYRDLGFENNQFFLREKLANLNSNIDAKENYQKSNIFHNSKTETQTLHNEQKLHKNGRVHLYNINEKDYFSNINNLRSPSMDHTIQNLKMQHKYNNDGFVDHLDEQLVSKKNPEYEKKLQNQYRSNIHPNTRDYVHSNNDRSDKNNIHGSSGFYKNKKQELSPLYMDDNTDNTKINTFTEKNKGIHYNTVENIDNMENNISNTNSKINFPNNAHYEDRNGQNNLIYTSYQSKPHLQYSVIADDDINRKETNYPDQNNFKNYIYSNSPANQPIVAQNSQNNEINKDMFNPNKKEQDISASQYEDTKYFAPSHMTLKNKVFANGNYFQHEQVNDQDFFSRQQDHNRNLHDQNIKYSFNASQNNPQTNGYSNNLSKKCEQNVHNKPHLNINIKGEDNQQYSNRNKLTGQKVNDLYRNISINKANNPALNQNINENNTNVGPIFNDIDIANIPNKQEESANTFQSLSNIAKECFEKAETNNNNLKKISNVNIGYENTKHMDRHISASKNTNFNKKKVTFNDENQENIVYNNNQKEEIDKTENIICDDIDFNPFINARNKNISRNLQYLESTPLNQINKSNNINSPLENNISTSNSRVPQQNLESIPKDELNVKNISSNNNLPLSDSAKTAKESKFKNINAQDKTQITHLEREKTMEIFNLLQAKLENLRKTQQDIIKTNHSTVKLIEEEVSNAKKICEKQKDSEIEILKKEFEQKIIQKDAEIRSLKNKNLENMKKYKDICVDLIDKERKKHDTEIVSIRNFYTNKVQKYRDTYFKLKKKYKEDVLKKYTEM